MLEDTNSLDGAHISNKIDRYNYKKLFVVISTNFTFIYMHIVAWSHTNYTKQFWLKKTQNLKETIKALLKGPENDMKFTQK